MHERKIRKARAKKNKDLAERLQAARPSFRLDHIVKERCAPSPTGPPILPASASPLLPAFHSPDIPWWKVFVACRGRRALSLHVHYCPGGASPLRRHAEGFSAQYFCMPRAGTPPSWTHCATWTTRSPWCTCLPRCQLSTWSASPPRSSRCMPLFNLCATVPEVLSQKSLSQSLSQEQHAACQAQDCAWLFVG